MPFLLLLLGADGTRAKPNPKTAPPERKLYEVWDCHNCDKRSMMESINEHCPLCNRKRCHMYTTYPGLL